MVLKVTMKDGCTLFYAGKKDGRIILVPDRKMAKEYKPGAKGTLNQIRYQIGQIYSGAKSEYEN